MEQPLILSATSYRTWIKTPQKHQDIEWLIEFESFLLESNLSASTIKRHMERSKKFCHELASLCNKSIHSLEAWRNVNLDHLLIYEQYLKQKLDCKEIKIRTAYNTLYSVKIFLAFLTKKNGIMYEYEIPKEFANTGSKSKYIRKKSKKIVKKKKSYPKFFNDFEKFLCNNNYSSTTIQCHKARLSKFLKDFSTYCRVEIISEDDLSQINLETISVYENHLINRVSRKEIKQTTAYECMKTVRLFLLYLRSEQKLKFKYDIPRQFVVQPIRENSYVYQEVILELIKSILSNPSKIRIRNLALLLLYVDTGCRPIEASNTQLSDLDLSEKTIKLSCAKSGMRKLSINRLTVNVLKQYLLLREELSPNSDYLFLNSYGEKPTSQYLTTILLLENKKAFGVSKVTARGLRHTYVTNALDNKNDFKEVSETMGHKHWVSTLYYLHRSTERLLTNTLPFNPLALIE